MKAKFIYLLRLVCLIYLVFLVPKVVSVFSSRGTSSKGVATKNLYVLFGIENLLHSSVDYKDLKHLKFGLICNGKSCDQQGNRTIDLLSKGGFCIKKAYINEEEKSFVAQNMFMTEGGKDSATGIPLCFCSNDLSLFLDKKLWSKICSTPGVKNKKELDFDAFFVDLQVGDVPTKQVMVFLKKLLFFSYRNNKRVVFLDRPNLFGGIIEGPGTVPWRHGLTIGELALYVNRFVLRHPANLTIVPMKRWRRESNFKGFSGRELIPRGLELLLDPLKSIYPLKMMRTEGNTFDRRYVNHILLSPEEKLSKWEVRYLKRLCSNLGIRCFDYSETSSSEDFDPQVMKLYLKNNVDAFSAFNALLTISRFLKNRKQIQLSFENKLDKELGLSDVREFLQDKITFRELKQKIEKSLISFYDKSKYCCLYKPLPRVVRPELAKI